MKLAALYSGGKDSNFAIFLAKEHEIACLITLKSKNPDSYMFHTPNIHLTELQSKALNIQLIEEFTEGEKEKELEDLERAIKEAKDKYKIKGVLTGALYSKYQRERIEKIAKKLNLETVSPLWDYGQEREMRDIIDEGFKFIITKISALGLDRSWLGKIITHKDIDKLVNLNKKLGINISFEGGEAETLVISGPTFKKKLIIKKAKKIMENEHTGYYKITKIELK